jgi:2-dehydropantoate 2-reductase
VNFLIYGAGAVGSVVGGRLSLAGHNVVFLARPAKAEALQARGLQIISGNERQVVRKVNAVPDPAEAFNTTLDRVIFTVKSHDTEDAIGEIRSLGITPPPILCLQNGVDNETALAEAFGADNVIAGTVTTTVTMDEPGVAVVQRERGVGLAAGSIIAPSLAEALGAAGFTVQAFEHAASMKWSKMLVNLIGNATSATCDVATGEVFDHPGLYELEIRSLRECLAVMHAKGIGAVNLPRLPTGWLAAGLRALPPWALQVPLRYLLRDARGGRAPSFHADLMRGNGRSEVGWLNGAVVRHGQEAGVPTPVNRLLTETLEGILAGRLAWEDFRRKPERLLAELKE